MSHICTQLRRGVLRMSYLVFNNVFKTLAENIIYTSFMVNVVVGHSSNLLPQSCELAKRGGLNVTDSSVNLTDKMENNNKALQRSDLIGYLGSQSFICRKVSLQNCCGVLHIFFLNLNEQSIRHIQMFSI